MSISTITACPLSQRKGPGISANQSLLSSLRFCGNAKAKDIATLHQPPKRHIVTRILDWIKARPKALDGVINRILDRGLKQYEDDSYPQRNESTIFPHAKALDEAIDRALDRGLDKYR